MKRIATLRPWLRFFSFRSLVAADTLLTCSCWKELDPGLLSPWVKCLFSKYDDLSFVSQYAWACNLRVEAYLGLLLSILSIQNSELWVHWDAVAISEVESSKRRHPVLSSDYQICTHGQALLHMRQCIPCILQEWLLISIWRMHGL